jgi:hypothetical protein
MKILSSKIEQDLIMVFISRPRVKCTWVPNLTCFCLFVSLSLCLFVSLSIYIDVSLSYHQIDCFYSILNPLNYSERVKIHQCVRSYIVTWGGGGLKHPLERLPEIGSYRTPSHIFSQPQVAKYPTQNILKMTVHLFVVLK